jgi:Domain of unknown function (DUF4338)
MMIKPRITPVEIELIQNLISSNPTWSRTRLSNGLCRIWDWRHPDGHPKEISCRDLLRQLDAKGLIVLPTCKQQPVFKPGHKNHIQLMLHDIADISSDIRDILPVRLEMVHEGTFQIQEFKSLIAQYHYLGFDRNVGENLKYMAYDRQGKSLACLLFGSAAWACAPRDQFIGWNAASRRNHLIYTTNNTRFLILPWVKVPHLASHILGLIVRRIAADWQRKYGHPLYLLETFVEKERFKGTCYKAANWIYVGETTGRSRNDRYSNLQVPIKEIYLYPLCKHFRGVLSDAALS